MTKNIISNEDVAQRVRDWINEKINSTKRSLNDAKRSVKRASQEVEDYEDRIKNYEKIMEELGL